MKHLNRNLLCAVAVKTTGPDAQKHEILEIAVIPLSPDCKVSKKHIPFNFMLKPDSPNRAEHNINNTYLMDCCERGMDPYEAAELFETWFEKLNMWGSKNIMVLCHDWAAKRDFFKEWLQPTAFAKIFNTQYRDPQAIGLYFNDYDDRRNELCRFPKVTLSYMTATQKIEYPRGLPTVIDECQACINLYKSLLNETR